MPPQLLINYHFHRKANMAGKNDFTKFFLHCSMFPTFCFTLPGLYNSGPLHWQTRWEELHGFTRIHQRDWDTPDKDDWIHTLNEIIAPFPPDQVILVGHSLSCITIAHWAHCFGRRIKGAFLVAPSDVEAASFPSGTNGFDPIPLHQFPFPSILVASSNDGYISLERAELLARRWGSRLVIAGDLGHINASSGLGDWEDGYQLLQTLF